MPITNSSYSNNRLQPAQWPHDAKHDAMRFGASLTIAKGTLIGVVTATGHGAAYNDALATGVETAVAIAMYDFKTDASGNVYLGDSATATYENVSIGKTAPVFISGVFNEDDLTGYDAAALADFNGRVLHNGFIYLP